MKSNTYPLSPYDGSKISSTGSHLYSFNCIHPKLPAEFTFKLFKNFHIKKKHTHTHIENTPVPHWFIQAVSKSGKWYFKSTASDVDSNIISSESNVYCSSCAQIPLMIYWLLYILSGKQYSKRSSLTLSEKPRESQRNNPKSLLYCFICL